MHPRDLVVQDGGALATMLLRLRGKEPRLEG